jgi:hypothetical protein
MRISFRSDRHDAKFGSMPATHCADLLTGGENHRCCNVRSCPKKCDKALYYLTTDRGAPCAFYPALKRSMSRASPVVRRSSINCDQAKIGKSITKADSSSISCIRYAGSLVTSRAACGSMSTPWSRSGCDSRLQFRRRKAAAESSQADVKMSGSVDSGR